MKLQDLEELQQKDFRRDYRLQALLTLIPKTGKKILDIGSGNGEMAISLSRKAKIVYATDNSEILLKKLRAKTTKIPNLKVVKIDAQNFSFKEKNFDLITACDVIEHLKNDTEFLKTCYNHLAKNGNLFISVPAIKFLYGIRDKKLGHHRRYDKNELNKKIEKAGFVILKSQYWNFLGTTPYLISEKILTRELVGPARHNLNNFFLRFLNKLLYFWLVFEGKINFLPIGLSLIILAQKGKSN